MRCSGTDRVRRALLPDLAAVPPRRPVSGYFRAPLLILQPRYRSNWLRRGAGSRILESMSLEALWPLLHQESRDWLIANNGDALSAQVLDDIARAGGRSPSDAWWVGENGPDGFYLSDAGIDWIEAVANGEVPDSPSDD